MILTKFSRNVLIVLAILLCSAIGLSIGLVIKSEARIQSQVDDLSYLTLSSLGEANATIDTKKTRLFDGYGLSDLTAGKDFYAGVTFSNELLYSVDKGKTTKTIDFILEEGETFSEIKPITDTTFGVVATIGDGTSVQEKIIVFNTIDGTYEDATSFSGYVIQSWFVSSNNILLKYGGVNNPSLVDLNNKTVEVLPFSVSSELKGLIELNGDLVAWGKDDKDGELVSVGYSLANGNQIKLSSSINGRGNDIEQIVSYNNDYIWYTVVFNDTTRLYEREVLTNSGNVWSPLFSSQFYAVNGEIQLNDDRNILALPTVNNNQEGLVLLISMETGKVVDQINNVSKIIFINN